MLMRHLLLSGCLCWVIHTNKMERCELRLRTKNGQAFVGLKPSDIGLWVVTAVPYTWSHWSWSPCRLQNCHTGGCEGCFLGDIVVSLKNTVISVAMPCRLVNRGPQYLYFQGEAVPGNTIKFLLFLDCWSQGEGTAIPGNVGNCLPIEVTSSLGNWVLPPFFQVTPIQQFVPPRVLRERWGTHMVVWRFLLQIAVQRDLVTAGICRDCQNRPRQFPSLFFTVLQPCDALDLERHSQTSS